MSNIKAYLRRWKMKLSAVVHNIEKRIPRNWAEDWDNTGLAFGTPASDIKEIALALDVTEQTVSDASKFSQLLVTHHPIIFRAMKSIVTDKPAARAIANAIKHDIALYSLHTNWDSSPEGVNVILADLLGLRDAEPLEEPKYKNGAFGIGAFGSFDTPLIMTECIQLLKERWRVSDIAAFGDRKRVIRKIAIGGGSCGDMWQRALDKGSDLFITSDISYHHRQDALSMGLNLIETDHGETERLSLPALKKIIEKETSLPVTIIEEEPVKRI